jgi:hypothetical protein
MPACVALPPVMNQNLGSGCDDANPSRPPRTRLSPDNNLDVLVERR